MRIPEKSGGARHRAAGGVRTLLLACALGLALGACDGSNIFKPCDPDGTTPHTPCPQTPAE